jgi:hypothetical protein
MFRTAVGWKIFHAPHVYLTSCFYSLEEIRLYFYAINLYAWTVYQATPPSESVSNKYTSFIYVSVF